MSVAAPLWGFDLAVFTNEQALRQTFSYYRQGAEGLEVRPFPNLPPATSPILATSPLSRADYFRAALLGVGSLYPAGTVDAYLIVNTHGAEDLALTPRVFADISLTHADELLAAVDGAGEAGGTPRWAAVRGTDKVDFWQPLAEAGERYGMQFPLVFREACASGIASLSEFLALPGNVGSIAHTGTRTIYYDDIDYGKIFASAPDGRSQTDLLFGALREHSIDVEGRSLIALTLARDLILSHPYLFFLPLLLWLLWFFGWPMKGKKPQHGA